MQPSTLQKVWRRSCTPSNVSIGRREASVHLSSMKDITRDGSRCTENPKETYREKCAGCAIEERFHRRGTSIDHKLRRRKTESSVLPSSSHQLLLMRENTCPREGNFPRSQRSPNRLAAVSAKPFRFEARLPACQRPSDLRSPRSIGRALPHEV